jgi:acetyl esterase/lipase
VDLTKDWSKQHPSERSLPGFAAFTKRKSPLLNVDSYNKPMFLFHADDDVVVTQDDTLKFVSLMKAAKKPITFWEVAGGGHYQPMIDTGLTEGIKFLIGLGAKPVPAKIGGD